MAQSDQSAYLVIPGYRARLSPHHIRWIQGEGNYSYIHLTSGKPLLVAQTLRLFEPLLPGFIRTHKSSMVNPQHVKSVRDLPDKKTGVLVLTGGVELLVARRRFDSVRGTLQDAQLKGTSETPTKAFPT